MANIILTPTMITREALRVLHNNIIFVKGVNRQYSNEFAISGAKIGSTLNIRKPNRYYVRRGVTLQSQDIKEVTVPLTLNVQYGVDVNFTSAELTLSLDDFSKRILTPAMAKVASAIDADGLLLTKQIYNQVGTPGVSPGTGTSGTTIDSAYQVQPLLNAGMMLDVNATPRDENRRCVLSPAAMASMTGSLSGLFQDAGSIGEQYKRGVLGLALGFEVAMDQNTINIYTGTRGTTAVVDGASQTGSSLKIKGLSGGATIFTGEVFNITNVNGVNPENQQEWRVPVTAGEGDINFVVLADATADDSGAVTLSISPSITLTGSTTPDGTVTSSPADGAAIHWKSGDANSVYLQSLAYHQDAFTFATADLELPQGVDFAARENYDGISMRIVRAYDITNDQYPCRIDVLGGWAVLRPEMACRITG